MAIDKKKGFEAPSPASDKKKALDTAIAQIEKNFGKGTVMRLGDKPEMQIDAIPTGSLALDAALGIGGAQELLDRHYLRKHGKNAYYGQK